MPSALPASASVAADEAAPAPGAAADLFLTLAAAFTAPPAHMSARDWSLPLAADLEELGEALELDTAAAVRTLHAIAVERGAGEPWLVDYSRLFLVPPVPVTLNTGMYLEGSLGGSSAQMMQQCYGTAGFAVRETFRDLPDHVAIQLEFVAALLRRADAGDAMVRDMARDMAREFTDAFIAHWVDPLHAACGKAAVDDSAARAYASLVDVLCQAADPSLL
jgi:TorA maturation chaperone TorD